MKKKKKDLTKNQSHTKHETNKTLLVPLKESCNMRVSLLSRKGTRLSFALKA